MKKSWAQPAKFHHHNSHFLIRPPKKLILGPEKNCAKLFSSSCTANISTAQSTVIYCVQIGMYFPCAFKSAIKPLLLIKNLNRQIHETATFYGFCRHAFHYSCLHHTITCTVKLGDKELFGHPKIVP